MQMGRVAQSVTCLTIDTCLTAIQVSRVRSRLGPILSLSFHHEKMPTDILLPSADSRKVVVKRKYVHEVLVNRLVKLAQEKCGKVN